MTSNEVNEKLDKTADAISDVYEMVYDLRAAIRKVCQERDVLHRALLLEKEHDMTQDELNKKIEKAENALNEAYDCMDELRVISDPWRNVDDQNEQRPVSLIHYSFFNAIDEITANLDHAKDVFSSIAWTLCDSSEDCWKSAILDAINGLEMERAAREESFSVERTNATEEDAPYLKEDCTTETDDWDVNVDEASNEEVVISTEKKESFE